MSTAAQSDPYQGTPSQLAENWVWYRNVSPQRLKPDLFFGTYGMPEGIPRYESRGVAHPNVVFFEVRVGRLVVISFYQSQRANRSGRGGGSLSPAARCGCGYAVYLRDGFASLLAWVLWAWVF